MSPDTSSTTSSRMNLQTSTLELTKSRYSDNERSPSHVLFSFYTLDKILRLLHPIMPFVTERNLWTNLQKSSGTAEYPTVNPAFEDLTTHTGVENSKASIAVRNARAEVSTKLSPSLVETSDGDLEAFC